MKFGEVFLKVGSTLSADPAASFAPPEVYRSRAGRLSFVCQGEHRIDWRRRPRISTVVLDVQMKS
jgi:hypothetical protein